MSGEPIGTVEWDGNVHHVSARSAVQQVVSGAAIELVIAAAGVEPIVAAKAKELITPRGADEIFGSISSRYLLELTDLHGRTSIQ